MDIVLIALLTIIAGGVGTLTGFGTSTILVPALVLFFPLPVVLLIVGIIHWFGNIWKLLLFREGVRWRLIALFGIPGIVLTVVGARLVVSAPQTPLARALGAALIVYTIFLLTHRRFRIPARAGAAVTGGALSGFFSGLFGVGGAIRSAFLAAFHLPKAVYIATAGAIGLAIDSTRLVAYATEGIRLPAALLWGLLAFIPASLLGAYLAKRIAHRIPETHFRAVVALFLLLAGVKLLLAP